MAPALLARQERRHRHRARPVHGVRERRARPHRRALDLDAGGVREAEHEARVLHVARVPDRAPPRQQRHQPQGRPALPRRPQGLRHQLERPARLRVGRGPRQRRPRAPRGVLRRLDVDAEPRGHGLRAPVRLRHLPAEDRQRLPGRGARQLAQGRLSVGDEAPRVHAARPFRRTRRVPQQRQEPAVGVGAGRDRRGRAVRPADRRLPRRGQHAAPVEREGGRRVRPRGLQQGLLRRGRRGQGAR